MEITKVVKPFIRRGDQYFGNIVYLDTGTSFIILAVDQNIFKLQLYNNMGLKCTHGF